MGEEKMLLSKIDNECISVGNKIIVQVLTIIRDYQHNLTIDFCCG
jgi:sRNA-binding carbon storage regulator CsrA